MKLRALVVLGLSGVSGHAFAEGGCPQGYYPYDTPQIKNCVPIPGGTSSAPPQPLVIFKDRWGAVAWDNSGAVDGESGIGVASEQSSRHRARKKALAQCLANGGTKKGCEVISVYVNGCVAMAMGETGMRSPHFSDNELGATLSALRSCNADTKNCRIYYSACSLPERML
jgi:hypothetical protein